MTKAPSQHAAPTESLCAAISLGCKQCRSYNTDALHAAASAQRDPGPEQAHPQSHQLLPYNNVAQLCTQRRVLVQDA
jgi:hypothetical protein